MSAVLVLPEFELRGPEVRLRPLEAADAEALAAASGESREHYRWNHVPEGLDGVQASIARALAQKARGQRHPFTVIWRERIVGTTSYSDYQPWEWPAGSALQRHDRPDSVEIGHTWLAASAQRTGCNTQAKYLLLRHAFETWHVHSVCLRTDERNQRSRRAIERLGCAFDGIRRAHVPGADGTVRNSAFFSIIAAEWPSVRERIEALLQRPARSGD
jgi:RimJ/RimL family protein N-acetyltransferase